MKMLNVNSIKMAGLAGSSFLLSKVKPEWGQRFLYENLKKYPGVPAKFSQWLEQKWDLKSDLIQPLLPVEMVSTILSREIPDFWSKVVSISSEAFVASIGQVHRITLQDGLELAVKIQYPELSKEVTEQIDQLIWMMEKSPAKNFGFDAKTWQDDLQTMFGEELDYLGEMARQQKVASLVGENPWVLVPRVYPSWCTKSILVQEYLPGMGLEKLLLEPASHRQQVGDELMRVLIRFMLRMPILHGDLQPKNWAWCSIQKKIILYDFGSCIDWSSNKQRVFESLVDAAKGDRGSLGAPKVRLTTQILNSMEPKIANEIAPMDYLVALGFDREKLLPINPQLPLLLERFLEPFYDFRLTRISDWQIQKSVSDILGDQSWYFRSAGPPWFLWLLRSLNSVFFAYRELSSRNQIADIYSVEAERLSPDRWNGFEVVSQRNYVESGAGACSKFGQGASALKLRVTEGTEEVVALEFPIHVLQRLEEVMDPELLEKLKEQKLNLEAIKSQAYRSGLIRQELFKIQKGLRCVRVWIE